MTPQPPHGAGLGTYAEPAERPHFGRWTRRRRAGSGAQGSLSLRAHPVGAPEGASTAQWLDELWECHAKSVYTLACALLGDEKAAAQAVKLGMADLADSSDSAPPHDAHRSWAHHVYLRSQEIADETSGTDNASSDLTSLSRLAPPQRICLALCLFGGHTRHEVASLLGVPAITVADLLTTGLRDVKGLATGGTTASA